jgi:fibronectin type 3 domain-containing protein/regulation of enolase protein 1 (concanavalin A-like superfamily)
MSGLGNGVWVGTGGADDCQFVYQAMTGDCALVAQVTSFTSSGSQNGKVGLMLRDNLSPTVSERGWIGVTWQNSSTTNLMECRQDGWTENWGGSGWASRSQVLPPGLPYWLKIERRGNLVTTYSSQDGTSWAPIVSSYYGNLPSTVYIGMFLCSGNTTTNTATFANVAFTGGSGGLVTTPAAPAALFTSGSGKAITVRWLPSFGATAYDLLRSTTSGSGYAVIASNLTASKTSYVDANVSAGTTYYYVVQAKNSAGTSGNSPEFYAALLPVPMVNLAFSGTSTASFNGNSTTEGSAKAFDRDPGSKWFGYNAPTGWLQYDFGVNDAQVVKRYTISSADVAARDPGAWNFLASQDGTNWTTLDSQTNQSFANRMQQNTYNIGNTTAYRYYRLDITTNNGDPGVAVAELGLWGESGRTIPDGRYRLVSRNSNKVMDGGAITNGAPVLQQTYTGGNSQQWEIAWQGNGRYRATAVGSTNAIDNGGTSSTGANLVVQPWSGGTSQLWNIIPDSDNFYRLTSANSGLVADVSSGSTADGANIIQWTSNGGDNQEWMPSLGRGTQPPPIPPAPTDLSASAVSSSQINLTWAASPGATSYNVKRATISGGPYTTIGTASDTSFTDVAVVTNQTYYYVVTALNSGGESGNSQEASAVPQEALHAYLKFDEFSGTNAADSTGNGWNGTLVNGPTWVAGYSNNAANLSGSSQYVTLPAGVLTNLNDFTISAWVKQTTISTWSRIFDFGTGQSVYMFLTPRNGANNVVRFAITTGGGNGEQRIDGAAALPTNVWTHVAVTLSGSTGVLYVNGVPVGTNSAMTLKPGDLGATTQNYIGKSQFNDPYFNGQVDEFRIYRTALSPADVATLVTPLAAPTGLSATAGNGQVALSWNSVAKAVYYHVSRSLTSGGPYTTIASLTATSYTDTTAVNGTTYYYVVTAVNGAGESANSSEVSVTPSDLQDWWTFDTSSGTVAADSGIGGNNGTLQSGASWVSGIINNAVHLDGTSSAYVSYPIGMVSNLNNFSLASWVRVDSTARWARIFDFGSGTGTYMFMTANSGSGTLRYAITTSGSGGEQQLNSAALSTGVWHHVVVTLSGSTGVLYVDGAAVNTNSNMTLSPASLGVTTQNYLGKSQWNDPYLTGSVDDFRIYSRALSASEVAAFVAGIIPAPPTGLAATAGNAQVSLTWNASANASSYNVKRATVNGGPYTTVANAATTGYTDTSVANGTTYYYVVSALNAGTESADSTPASAMPQVPPPATPTGLAATAGNAQVALSWNASSGAASYNLKRATVNGGPYTTLANLTATGYTDTNVINGLTYYYVVSAVNAGGESANSTQVNATPQVPAPATPTGLAAAPDYLQITLSWNSSSGATSYDVKRATVNGGPYTTITNVAKTSFTDDAITMGTTYYYVVSAVNAGGESANSSQVDATSLTLPSPWSTADIGAVGLAGSAMYSNSIYTVTGSGADTWGASDQFRYVYQTGGTNCSITAQVLTMTTNSSAAAKGGVMVRESLATNSVMCEMQMTALNGAENLWRASTGGNVTGVSTAGLHAPYWVRITRAGSKFTSYRSSDGITWTPVSTNTITMASSVNVGLFVCSHNNSALCTATFTNVVASP